MKIIRAHAVAVCILLALSTASSPAQSVSQKFNDAIKRSDAGAEVVTRLAQLSQSGIPKELIDKAEAAGVFPCKKTDLLIEHAVICAGAISRHLQTGWTQPAFYRFAGGGFGRPDQALGDSATIILLFMDSESIDWLREVLRFTGEKEAKAGPLGSITSEQRLGLAKAHIITYADRKGELTARDLRESSAKAIALNQDNHLNQQLYGMKGHEVLAGKKVGPTSLPDGIAAFRDALQKYYPSH
jgi:lipid-binding SYLF domain-containing protein